jgi:hypothetical protein
MDADLYLVLGVFMAILAVPSLLSAYSEGRAPRVGAIFALAAGVLIVTALNNKPGGYEIQDIPQTVFRVIGRYLG